MKKQVMEALNNRFEGVNSAILERIAEKLSKTTSTAEEVSTAVEGITLQQIIEAYGDSRANEAQQTAIRNYEAKHGLKNGLKTVPEAESKVEANAAAPVAAEAEAPAWAKAILEQNKLLAERLTGMERDKVVINRRTALGETISKLPDPIRAAYARTPIDNLSDEEFDAVHDEIRSEVERITMEHNARGAVFGRPLSGGVLKPTGAARKAGEATEEEAEAVVERLNI